MGELDDDAVRALERMAAKIKVGMLSVTEVRQGDDERVSVHVECCITSAGERDASPAAAAAQASLLPGQCPKCKSINTRDVGAPSHGEPVELLCIQCDHVFQRDNPTGE